MLHDLYANYDLIWQASIALGVLSAILHLLVQDRAMTPEALILQSP